MHIHLLHGLGADHRAFQRFARLLPDEWTVTAHDLLGHGEGPHPISGYALEQHAEHVASMLTQSPGRPCVLVGHSYGAATTVATAARYPQLVDAIVLLDPVASLDTREFDPESGTGSRTGMMITAKRNGSLADTITRLWPNESPALRAWILDTWTKMAVGVVDELDPDWMRYADAISCPVGVISGQIERGGSGDVACDYFEGAAFTEITGAGHYLHASHAQETASALVNTVNSFSLG